MTSARPFCLALLAAACCSCAGAPSATARAWPEADALFRHDVDGVDDGGERPRFLGADSAYAAPLPGGRVLWLFGDTFVSTAPPPAGDPRAGSRMVRNSVAVMNGRDPSAATTSIRFFFGAGADGPASFFPDAGDGWTWPGTPALVRDPATATDKLLLFLWKMAPSDGGLGFALDHTEAVLVENPADVPPAWRTVPVPVADAVDGFRLGTGGALVDGDTLFLLAAREPGDHEMALFSVPAADAARGDLSALALKGDAGFRGQTELSLTHAAGAFEVVDVDGFGQAPIELRTVSSLSAPSFSAPAVVYREPEIDRDGVLLYSAKAHPELSGADLVVTYCSNHTDFATLTSDPSLYFPRFVRITLEKR